MIITYLPEGETPREFEFLPSNLLSPEAEAIENVGGDAWDTFEEFGQKFLRGSIRAYRAALWIMLKRENPKLRFQDLAFKVGEVSVDYSKTELTKLREVLQIPDTSMPESQRLAALAEINSAIEDKEFEGIASDLKDPTEKSENDSSTSAMPDSLPDSEN